MKFRITLISLFSLLSTALAAAPVGVSGWQRPAMVSPAATEAAAVVRDGLQALLAFLETRPDQAQLGAFLQEQVVDQFDFERMTALVLGRAGARLEQQRRGLMVKNIRQDFLQTLGRRLAGFEQQRIRFFRPRPMGMNRAVVTVGIANPGGYPARLDFHLYRGDAGWKVYDVAANGNSAVAYYRQKFAAAWRRQPVRPQMYR